MNAEKFALESFKHFNEDLDVKTRQKFLDADRKSYYAIIVSNEWVPRTPMYFEAKNVDKYSFLELYNKMCDLFWDLDEEKERAIYDIFRLKNFVNYKMRYGG